MDSLEKVRELMSKGKEDEIIRNSDLVEKLPYYLHDERRPLTILVIDGFIDKLERKDTLTLRDIQSVRLLHSQIMDLLQETLDKGLKAYLETILQKLEKYLDEFYRRFGYLPPYAYWEDDYLGRRKRYDFYYPIRTYYAKKYPEREVRRTQETLTGLDLTEETKDLVKSFLEMPFKYSGHPDDEIQKVLEYTADKLKQDLEELRKKRLEKEAKLSKDEKQEKLVRMIDLIVEGLKSYKLGE